MNPAALIERLPEVRIETGLPAVERAEFVDLRDGEQIVGYVVGWTRVDVGPALVYGNLELNRKVRNHGAFTTISVFPLCNIRSYTVLEPIPDAPLGYARSSH